MKRLWTLVVYGNVLVALAGCEKSQQSAAPSKPEATAEKMPAKVTTPAPAEKPAGTAKVVTAQLAEAGCGSCVFHMEGVKGCKLAVKIDDKPYLVTGADIDAHSAGLCTAAKKATITGRIEGGKFVAEQFALQPDQAVKPDKGNESDKP